MMKLFRRYQRSLAALVLTCVMPLLFAGQAQAAMVGTQSVLSAQQAELDRSQILTMLEADELRQQLTALGVDADAAAERVALLSDEELRELNGQLNELPAGSDALGVLVFLFLVLLITDILGLTDIFPFVKK